MTRDEYVEFLRKDLIPDLRASGMNATANDFEICADLIEDVGLDEVNVGEDCPNPYYGKESDGEEAE